MPDPYGKGLGESLLPVELLDDCQNIVLTNDHVLGILQIDLGAGVLAGDDLVADLHGHGDFLAVYHDAGAHGDDFGHRGLFLGAAGEDDAARGGLLGLDHFQDDTVSKRCEFHLGFLLII